MRLWPILLLLPACTQFPELEAFDSVGVRNTPYPQLLPLDGLLNPPEARATTAQSDQTLARAERLRARADGLRRPVIDARTRNRMAHTPS